MILRGKNATDRLGSMPALYRYPIAMPSIILETAIETITQAFNV
jgi:hypothetical protein